MSGLRPSGLHINKPVLLGLVCLFCFVALFYKYVWASGATTVHTSGLQSILGGPDTDSHNKLVAHAKTSIDKITGGSTHPVAWNVSQLIEPPALDEEAKKKLARKSELFDVNIDGTTIQVYVQQVISSNLKTSADILFLHGARFSSQNWQEIGALDQVASWGYRAVAIDLPGKGKTTQSLQSSQITAFLPALVKKLEIKMPVIVAPSMSGQYAIPYLFGQAETSTERAKGFVPVAPIGTALFVSSFPKSQLPTLIVHGDTDPSGPLSLKDLGALPRSINAQVPKAGHACYLDQPAIFFKYLHTFLKKLYT